MRRLLIILLLVLGTLFISLQFGQISRFVDALRDGQPAWIAVALISQLVWQALQVEQFRAARRLAGANQAWQVLAPVSIANNFVVVAAPSGSVSTFALFIADARRRGLSSPTVALGVVLFAVAEYIAVSLLIGTDLLELMGSPLFAWVLVPGLVLFGITGAFTASTWLGVHSPEQFIRWLGRVGHPLQAFAARLGRPGLFSEESLNDLVATVIRDFASLRGRSAKAWIWPLTVALVAKLALVALLGLVALAFDQPLPLPDLITIVTVGLVFTIVSPTPLGIGVAEGAIIFALITLGVSNEHAILICLGYRGFTLWLPMVYGFLALELSGLRSVFRPTSEE